MEVSDGERGNFFLWVTVRIGTEFSLEEFHLTLVLSYPPHTPPLPIHLPPPRLPLPHILCSHPSGHPLPPLSAVQSLLTELSLDHNRERKQLSAAFSQPERNSSPTAGWFTGLYRLIPRWRDDSGERARCKDSSLSAHGAPDIQTASVSTHTHTHSLERTVSADSGCS